MNPEKPAPSPRILRLSALILLAIAPGAQADSRIYSFNEIKRMVYAEPLRTLPKYSHFSLLSVAQALAYVRNEFMQRIGITMWDKSDIKEATPKTLHPMGACASGTWKITQETPATGLLAKGTEVPAIVRMSSSTNQVTYSTKTPRVLAVAVKLFPDKNPDHPVLGRNFLTTNENGLDGIIRKSFFFANDGAPSPAYYSNDAAGSRSGFVAMLGFKLFGRADLPSDYRPLYPLTETNADGTAVEQVRTPEVLQLIPHPKRRIYSAYEDFRDEIMRYQAGEIVFDLVLPTQVGISAPVTIGTLTLDQPVISVTCDQALTFHHNPMHRSIDNSGSALQRDTQLDGSLRSGPHAYTP